MNLTLGPSGGGGGASQASNSSRLNSSRVTSSAISSLSDSTGTEGLAGGGGHQIVQFVGCRSVQSQFVPLPLAQFYLQSEESLKNLMLSKSCHPVQKP